MILREEVDTGHAHTDCSHLYKLSSQHNHLYPVLKNRQIEGQFVSVDHTLL